MAWSLGGDAQGHEGLLILPPVVSCRKRGTFGLHGALHFSGGRSRTAFGTNHFVEWLGGATYKWQPP